jgi:hypothetical protein
MSSLFRSLTKGITGRNGQKGNSPGDVEASDSSSDSEESGEEPEPEMPTTKEVAFEFGESIDVSGGTGWSSTICAMYYHSSQRCLCVGTSEGTLFIHGRNQQWTRPASGDNPNRVISIIGVPFAPTNDMVLVLFEDGKVDLLKVPSMNLVASKSSKDLGCALSDRVVTLYVDEAGGHPYAYLGTSKGGFIVLECQAESIRLCNYYMPPFSAAHAQARMALISIRICPKDERYIGLAYGSSDDCQEGLVAIYDLAKHKLSSLHGDIAAASLEWDHEGEVLYAGTTAGEIYSLRIKQNGGTRAWKYAGDESDGAVQIRKLLWLAPQSQSSKSKAATGAATAAEDCCLFALLASSIDEDDGSISSNPVSCAVITLCPSAGGDDSLTESLLFPPPTDESVADFTIIPSSPAPMSLLMLTQRVNPGWIRDSMALLRCDKYARALQLSACPESPAADWGLEMGMLPDPERLSYSMGRVSVGAAPKVTYITSTVPSTSQRSLATALIRSAQQPSSSSSVGVEIPLVEVEDNVGGKKQKQPTASAAGAGSTSTYIRGNVVFVGYSTGLVSIFRVCRVDGGDGGGGSGGSHYPPGGGSGSYSSHWSLLKSLHVGSAPISSISVHEEDGVFVVGNSDAEVGLWGVSDAMSSPRELARTSVGKNGKEEEVTSTVIVNMNSTGGGGSLGLFIGTTTGNVYYCDLSPRKDKPVAKCVAQADPSVFRRCARDVSSMCLASFDSSRPALFVIHTCGVVEVVAVHSLEILAYGDVAQMAERNMHAQITAVCVANQYAGVPAEGGAPPRYLVATMGSAALFYRLDTFCIAGTDNTGRRAPVAIIKPVSNCNILSASVVALVDACTGELSTCVYMVDQIGVAAMVSLDPRHKPLCYQGLFDNLYKQQLPCVVQKACVSANGDAFTVKDDVVFSVSVRGSTHSFSSKPPASVVISLTQPNSSFIPLQTGREAIVEKLKHDLEKKKTTIFTLSAFVTDLPMVFAGSRADGSPFGDIYGGGSGGDHCEEGDEYDDVSSPSPEYIKEKSNEAMRTMQEARQNLDLRGQKIAELQEKSEELANSSEQYRADAADLNRKMADKKKRWSIF